MPQHTLKSTHTNVTLRKARTKIAKYIHRGPKKRRKNRRRKKTNAAKAIICKIQSVCMCCIRNCLPKLHWAKIIHGNVDWIPAWYGGWQSSAATVNSILAADHTHCVVKRIIGILGFHVAACSYQTNREREKTNRRKNDVENYACMRLFNV